MLLAYISRFIWLWLKRRGIKWDTQDRGDAPLSWDTCIRHFGWVSVLGLSCWAALAYGLAQTLNTQIVLLQAASNGWVKPGDALLWFFPILGGFSFSIWIARFTSLTFPTLDRLRLFSIPEEVRPPRVVDALVRFHDKFAAALPSTQDRQAALDHALGDPGFYVRQRLRTRLKSNVAAMLLPKIMSGVPLSDPELFLAFSERHCLDALHVRAAASS